MKHLLILLISVILFSCSNQNKRYHIDKTTTPSDTITYLKSDMKPLNGIVFCEFGDIGKYINGKKEGLHKEWYESGQISSELEYEHGERIFKRYMKLWNSDGQLMFEGKYYGDEQFEREYFYNGQLKWEVIYDNEDKVLSKKCWDVDGNKINCEEYTWN